MLSVHFPPSVNNEEVPFYLATEEYLAKYTNLECFFMWQVSPSVIIGRNQLMANEVNIEFCKKIIYTSIVGKVVGAVYMQIREMLC